MCKTSGTTGKTQSNSRQHSPDRRCVYAEIARFYGIVIKMFFKPKEHEPSHIHALYGEYLGEFNIRTMEMLQGDLPAKAQELVREWLSMHQTELQEMWDSQRITRLPPL